MPPPSDTWRIGALSRLTGLTVRALRHYHALGLVKPTHRTQAGHRLYGRRDVERLQQVQSLKQLGFSLSEIRNCLGTQQMAAGRIVELHLHRARTAAAAQQNLVARLESLKRGLHESGEVPVEDFVRTVEAIVMTERYFTVEQQELIRHRREIVGEARMRRVEQEEWPQLINDVKAAMDDALPPSSAHARELAKRWRALGEEFTGGDAGIAKGVHRMYTDEEPNAAQRHGLPLTREMIAYIAKAMDSEG